MRPHSHQSNWHTWVSTGNLLVGLVVALIAAVFSLGVSCAHAADRVDSIDSRLSTVDRRGVVSDVTQVQRIAELDRRLELVQQQLTATQTDVAWIRRELERNR